MFAAAVALGAAATLPADGVCPSDLWRFPPHADAKTSRVLATEHLRWVEGAEWEVYHRHPQRPKLWGEWLAEATRREACWRDLEQAHYHDSLGDGHESMVVQRLVQLRARLGADAYAAGRMPFPVPVEYFAVIE